MLEKDPGAKSHSEHLCTFFYLALQMLERNPGADSPSEYLCCEYNNLTRYPFSFSRCLDPLGQEETQWPVFRAGW
jgi:hypothetical protein